MKKPIFLLLLLCLNAFTLSAQSDALDREIASIVSDLATKMGTKTAIKNVAIADFTKLDVYSGLSDPPVSVSSDPPIPELCLWCNVDSYGKNRQFSI